MTTHIAATPRDLAKAERHDALLREAARLFAARGFDGVSLEDLGAAVGITGPAVYRHFRSKRALLGAILLRASEDLLAGGRRVREEDDDPHRCLRDLIDFHVDFAVTDAEVIRVHDRELATLSDDDRHRVRRLQREYVELWIGVLQRVHPDRTENDLRLRAHAGFGLINSTPYSVRALREIPEDAEVHDILSDMAYAALAAH
ncbi:TetR/AcrR family transcriptional regulator [Microbacterium sp.]|uniref:SACE_7040 family transcriptional regulator n=1 Tax=Microbacterium sp. TaxID=51671 RepID=UPI0039E615AD